MKNLTSMLIPLAILLAVGAGCGSLAEKTAGAYTSTSDSFSVIFPGGSSGVETEQSDAKFAKTGRTYSKSFDNRSDNYRSYEVHALEIDEYKTKNKPLKEILEIGLNGWEKEPETVVNETEINGQKAIDSVRSIEIGPAKMTFREVVLWSPKDKKLYVLQIAAAKKETVSAQEANDFVNSFRVEQ